jgi:hypothetical protein
MPVWTASEATQNRRTRVSETLSSDSPEPLAALGCQTFLKFITHRKGLHARKVLEIPRVLNVLGDMTLLVYFHNSSGSLPTDFLSIKRPQGGTKPCHVAIHAMEPTGIPGYLLKAGQLEYDCRYSKMHGMRITDGRGFRSLKPLLKVDKIHQEIYSDNTAL